MKTIHKLVLKSYLGPMFLTFFIVMFVLMMNFIWRYIDELVGKGLDAGVIIELMSYAMANMIPMGLPLAMLLAAIMTLGNLGENYELLAMKSAGMSLPKHTQTAHHRGGHHRHRQFLRGEQSGSLCQQEDAQHPLRHPPAETGHRIPGRALLQRHRGHEHPRRQTGPQDPPAARRADLRQPQHQRQHDHHGGRLGLHPPVGRQEIPARHALQRRDLRADAQLPVVQQKRAAPSHLREAGRRHPHGGLRFRTLATPTSRTRARPRTSPSSTGRSTRWS